jgi:hypothetical protein
MQSKRVKDFSGQSVAKGDLGTFEVNIHEPQVQAARIKAVAPASVPPLKEQAATVAADALEHDRKVAAAERDRKTASLASLFASLDDWFR